MANLLWLGHAPDVPQIDVISYNSEQAIAEGSDLWFTCNGKILKVEAPTPITDEGTDQGDTDGILEILQVAEAAINATDIPEFAEVEAEVESFAEEDYGGTSDMVLHRLKLTGREPGVPFSIVASAPLPSVDIDVVQEGGTGQNEIQEFSVRILSANSVDPSIVPTGGYYYVVWDLGNGLEQSAQIAYDATAAQVKSGMIAGMPSLNENNFTISGAGTRGSGTSANQNDPFIIELTGNLSLTSVERLGVDPSNLTGIAQGFVETVQEAQPGESNEIQGLVIYNPSGSTWPANLSFKGVSVELGDPDVIDYTASYLQGLLESMSTIGTGNVEVFGGHGTLFNVSHFLIRFIGDLGATNQPIMQSDKNYVRVLQHAAGGLATTPEIWVLDYDEAIGSGTFTITVGANTTSAIDVAASDADFQRMVLEIETEMNALASVDGVIVVENTYAPTEPDMYAAWSFRIFIIFAGQTGTNISDLTVDDALTVGGEIVPTKIQDGSTNAAINEVQSISTNGEGGTFTLTYSGQTTSALSPTSLASQIETALEALSNIDAVSVSGDGSSTTPWLVEFQGSLVGLDATLLTINTTNLTGGAGAYIDVQQEGGANTPQIWNVYQIGATGGTLTLEFNGRTTGTIAYNASAGTVQAALEALVPGDFTGLWTVTGAGTYASPWVIEVEDTLEGIVWELQANNEALTGTGQTLTQTTIQEATGKYWADNSTNYRNMATGLSQAPANGDSLYFQSGTTDNSMKYGVPGVTWENITISQEFSGEIGLPQLNPNGYHEYRETIMVFEFTDSTQSYDNPNLIIGVAQGEGSGLIRIRTNDSEVHARVERTGAPTEGIGFPAFVWDTEVDGTAPGEDSNTLELFEGSVGTAILPFSQCTLDKVVQRGGQLRFGEDTAIGDGGFDRLAGDTFGRCTIGGVPVIFGG